MERDQASKFVNDLLKLLIERKGSDLFLTADFPPAIKVDGQISKVSPQPLSSQHTQSLARAIMNDKQAAEFERSRECNFAIAPAGIGRFRVNCFLQMGKVGIVMRTIPGRICPRCSRTSLWPSAASASWSAAPDRASRPRWRQWSTGATRTPMSTS